MDNSKDVIEKRFGRSRSTTNILCVGLLLVSMVGGIGLSSFSSRETFAQEEQHGTDEGVMSQYDQGCTNFVELDCGAGTASDGATATGGQEQYGADTGGMSQYDQGCTNFVELDCGAATATGGQGSPAPIKPQYGYLVQGDPYAQVLNTPGMENQYCNPNSENCDIKIIKPYGGCLTIIAEGFQTENGDMTCYETLGSMEEPKDGSKVWEHYPVWESDKYLGEAMRKENVATVGGLLTCENAGEAAGWVTDVVGCAEGDPLSCAQAVPGSSAPELRPGEALKDIIVEKGTEFACEKAFTALGGQDTIERYKGYFLADMEQWCSEYGYKFDPGIYCSSLIQDYDRCAAKATSMGVPTIFPDTAIKYYVDYPHCSLDRN